MNKLTPEAVRLFLSENQLHFESTHRKVCFPILNRIYGKLLLGHRFGPIKTDGPVIVDGHHRYICLQLLALEVETIPWTKSLSSETTVWEQVEIDETDWETPEEIARHEKILKTEEDDVLL